MSTTKRPVNESSSTMPILSSVSSRRVGKMRTSQLAYGQPWVWLFGGTLIVCLLMIIGLLFLILRFGILRRIKRPGMRCIVVRPFVRCTRSQGRVGMPKVTKSAPMSPQSSK